MKLRLRCGIAGLVTAVSLFAAGSATAADTPFKNYRLFCMGCHGQDGSGSPDIGIPNMKGEVGQFLRLPAGRAYLSQVPGTLNTPLSDQQTAELLNWIMASIAKDSVPPGFTPYSGEEVARYRASVPLDIPGLRVKLLEQIKAGQ